MLPSSLTHTRLASCFAVVIALAIFWGGAPSAEAGESVIGDADGDGRFTADDVAYVESALDAEMVIPAQPGRVSDVAHPCDGRIDADDLLLLHRASRDRSLVLSECHDAPIGSTFGGFTGATNVLNNDEHFDQIAAEIPQFGGFYFDPLGPTVVLTEESEELFDAARKALFDRFGEERFGTVPFRYVLAEYGFGELYAWRESVLEVLGLPRVVALDIDEVSNRLTVTLETWDVREQVENALEGQWGIPLEAVELKLGGTVQMMHPYTGFIRPLRGGIELGFGGENESHCTLGPIVNRGGLRGFITNSHCTEEMGVVDTSPEFHQPFDKTGDSEPKASAAGVEMIDPKNHPDVSICANVLGPLCRWSDSAFVAIGKRAASSKGMLEADYSQATPTGYRHATSQGDPFYGETVLKSGRSTGMTAGTILATCLDQLGEAGHLRCQYAADNTIDPGDSGSPVFRSVGSYGADWVGLAWGEFGGWMYFSPISGLEKDLGTLDGLKGNDAPTITIQNPVEGQSIGQGALIPVELVASVFDPDYGKCSQCAMCISCEVTWTSDAAGLLGTTPVIDGQSTLSVVLPSVAQKITAEVEDPQGLTGSDDVDVVTTDGSPVVWITQPANNTTLWRDTTYLFQADSVDPELWGPLPCSSAIEWWSFSGNPPVLTPGCTIALTFATNGTRTINAVGTDSAAQTHTASVSVTVVDPPTTGPPTVTILEPAPGDWVPGDQPVVLSGIANDPDDVSPLTFEWLVQGSGLVGGGSEVSIFTQSANDNEAKGTLWMPSDDVISTCGGRSVQIALRVTDAQSSTVTETIPVTVMWPPC